MAVKLADAVTSMVTDDTQLKKGLADAETEVEGHGNRLGGVLQGIGMSIGMGVAGMVAEAGTAVVQFVGDSIASASDLKETISKANTLFGDSAASIMAWADNSATAMGLPKQAALDAVGTIGNLFMQLGASSGEAANVGQGMVQLSADIASFHNVAGGSAEVLDAMSAAFRGEYDALQRYIPTINGAAVEQEALAQTGKKSADELTNLEKAMAVQTIMARDAGAAIGDFARTSDGAANQQRILDANMANLQATLGQGLLPVWGALISALNTLVQAVMPPVTSFITNQMVPAMEAIGNVISATVGPMIEAAMSWFSGLGDTMEGQANGPFAYLKNWFEQNMPRIRTIVETVVGAISAFWAAHGERIMTVVDTFLGIIGNLWDTTLKNILDVVTLFLQLLTGDWGGALETIMGIVGRMWNFLRTTFESIVSMLLDLWDSIDWGDIGRNIIDGIIRGVRGAASMLADAARVAAQGALDAIKRFLGISSPSKVMMGVGANVMLGLQEGILQNMDAPAAAMGAAAGALMQASTTNTYINLSYSTLQSSGSVAMDVQMLSALYGVGVRR